jgi:hypothetical protein
VSRARSDDVTIVAEAVAAYGPMRDVLCRSITEVDFGCLFGLALDRLTLLRLHIAEESIEVRRLE